MGDTRVSDLFDNPIIPDGPAISLAERRKQQRRLRGETARGYFAPPGTGPEGETCKSCIHAHPIRLSKTYWKCELMRQAWTGGRRTDILVGSPACRGWEAKEAP